MPPLPEVATRPAHRSLSPSPILEEVLAMVHPHVSAPPSPAQDDAPTRGDWAGLVVISLAVGMVIVEITVVNVAIPTIIADLDTSATTAQWVQEAYTVALAVLLLPFGRLADK